MSKNVSLEEFKNGLFSFPTARFGKVSELLVHEVFKSPFLSSSYPWNKRVEVKSSRAFMKHDKGIHMGDGILEQIASSSFSNRIINSSDAEKYSWDCSIQQIKCIDFDILYYVIYFSDKISIFKVESRNVKYMDNYCNKQHKYNLYEGQFHVTERNFLYHFHNFHVRDVSYKELYDILKKMN